MARQEREPYAARYAAKRQHKRLDVEDEVPRKRIERLTESDSEDQDRRCENGGGVQEGDNSGDSYDRSDSDESDSVEIVSESTASCSTSSSSLMTRSSKQLTLVPVLAKNKRSKQARAFHTLWLKDRKH